MKNADSNKNIFTRLRDFGSPIIAGNTTAKVFFLVLSVFLWFLINLSKEGYSTTIEYPLKYYNFPADLKLMNDLPENIRVNVSGQGFEILGSYFTEYEPYELNVGRADTTNQEHIFQTSTMLEYIETEINDNLLIQSITPKQISFDFEKLYTKKVKVYLKGIKQFEGFKDLYQEPEFKPDSILVVGPREQIRKIDSIFTEPVPLTAEKDSLKLLINLAKPNLEGVDFAQDKVEVKLDFASITEGTFEVPVNITGVPSGYTLQVFPEEVQVTYRIPVRDFERINKEDFNAYIDFQEVDNLAETRFLRVKLKPVPNIIRKVSLNPRKVEFILSER